MGERYELDNKKEGKIVSNILRAATLEKDSRKWLYMLGTRILRKEIISIEFKNTLEGKPENCWDISAKGDGSVIGWTETREGGYDFFIAAEGTIIGNPDCKNLFRGCECLKSIKFNGYFDTSFVNNMEYMFYDCFALEDMDITSLNTFRVTNMKGMFGRCRNLKKLDISRFNTSQVTTMSFMFGACKELERLDTSSFVTSNVTDMKGMFAECSGLTELEIKGFDTSHVIDMAGMFRNCKSLKTLNIQNFDVCQVADARYMFGGCSGLRTLFLDTLNMFPGANKGGMFDGCDRQLKLEKKSMIKNILRSDEVKEVVDGQTCLLGTSIACRDIISINFLDNFRKRPVKYWDVSEEKTGTVTAWAEKRIDGYDFYIAGEGGVWGGASCMYLFQDCVRVQEIQFNNCFNTSQVTDMRFMFSGCGNLEQLDLKGFDTSKVTNMRAMFKNCNSLTRLDLKSFDTSCVTNMDFMFSGCESLIRLDITNFDTSKVTSMRAMFNECGNLKRIDIKGFNTDQVVDMELMFEGCVSLRMEEMKDVDLDCGESIGEMSTVGAGREDSLNSQENEIFIKLQELYYASLELPN